MKHLLVIAALLAQVPANAAIEESFHPEKLAGLDAEIVQAVTDGKIVGAALWVERDGVSYHKAFGSYDL